MPTYREENMNFRYGKLCITRQRRRRECARAVGFAFTECKPRLLFCRMVLLCVLLVTRYAWVPLSRGCTQRFSLGPELETEKQKKENRKCRNDTVGLKTTPLARLQLLANKPLLQHPSWERAIPTKHQHPHKRYGRNINLRYLALTRRGRETRHENVIDEGGKRAMKMP